jgi:hypothetical protein
MIGEVPIKAPSVEQLDFGVPVTDCNRRFFWKLLGLVLLGVDEYFGAAISEVSGSA